MAGRRPSKRRHHVETDVELKLVPVMSLMVVLVPMLLQTAVFQETAAIVMNLPSADEVTYLEKPDPQQLSESVTLAITKKGFTIATGEKILASLPRLGDGSFDFKSLKRELSSAKAKFPAQEGMMLLIEDHIVYDDIVHAMDQCRPYFPSVSLADMLSAEPEE